MSFHYIKNVVDHQPLRLPWREVQVKFRARQGNKSRDELLNKELATLSGKLADRGW